jgi:hypothetical protein
MNVEGEDDAEATSSDSSAEQEHSVIEEVIGSTSSMEMVNQLQVLRMIIFAG